MKRIFNLVICFMLLASTAAWGTVNSSTATVSYSCNGSTTIYTYPFQVLEDDDILAIKKASDGTETTLTLNSNYTVTGAGDDAGGTVVLTTGSVCASGYTLKIMRQMDLLQETDYVDGDAFSAESFEAALDKQTIILQELDERVDRSVAFPKTGESIANEIDGVEYVNRANKTVGFNADGDLALLPASISAVTLADAYYINISDAPYSNSLTALVSELGGTTADVLVDAEATTSAITTIPSNLRLHITKKGRINNSHLLTVNGDISMEGGYFNGSGDVTINTPFDAYSGTFTGSGAITINGPFAGKGQVLTGSGTLTFGQAALGDNIVHAEWFGTDLQAAIDSISYTDYLGSRVVQLQDGIFYDLEDTLTIPDGVTVRGTGVSYTATFNNAVIRASSTFGEAESADYSHHLINLGNPDTASSVYWSYGARLEDVMIDAHWMADTAVYTDSANEKSGVFGCWIIHPLKVGMAFDNSGYAISSDPRTIHTGIYNSTIIFGTESGIYPYKGTVDPSLIRGIVVQGNALSTGITANVNIINSSVTSTITTPKMQIGIALVRASLTSIKNSHVENCVYGINIDANSNGILIDTLDGHTTVTDLIYLGAGAQDNITLINIFKNSGTNIINDDRTNKAKLWTDNYISFFSTGNIVTEPVKSGDITSNPTTTDLGRYNFWGVDTNDATGVPRLAGSIWLLSNGSWAASADTDYAPAALYLGVGQASTTNTPITAPSIKLTEGNILVYSEITFTAVSAASVSNNSIFMDSSDNVIKIKDNTGTLRALY